MEIEVEEKETKQRYGIIIIRFHVLIGIKERARSTFFPSGCTPHNEYKWPLLFAIK